MTIEKTLVSPVVKMGDLEVNIPEVLSYLKVGDFFNVQSVLEVLKKDLKLIEVEAVQAEQVFEQLYYFAHIMWGARGYELKSLAAPEDMVKVKRTTGLSAGMGGTFIVPKNLVEQQFSISDGWTIIEEFSQT